MRDSVKIFRISGNKSKPYEPEIGKMYNEIGQDTGAGPDHKS
jgi:hypothetical protein